MLIFMSEFMSTTCAICGMFGESTELYSARLGEEAIDAQAFSARRFYDRKIHFRWVQCNQCGLLRSDPVLVAPEDLKKLYQESHFTYATEVKNLTKTYGRYLKKINHYITRKERLLEIGCGNGFFLEEALRQGYQEVYGVEPSREAVAKAPETIRHNIRIEMFKGDLFPQNFFDAICVFQTFDHVSDPAVFLRDCLALLKPGGVLLTFNHNSRSWSARILGERSPIIDIEHTYLYNTKTMRTIFERNGFTVFNVCATFNKISLGYLWSLVPIMPLHVKRTISWLLIWLRLGRISVWVPLGNLYCIAQKPIL